MFTVQNTVLGFIIDKKVFFFTASQQSTLEFIQNFLQQQQKSNSY